LVTTSPAIQADMNIENLLNQIFSSPEALGIWALRFILAFASGYITAKIVKYLIPLIILLTGTFVLSSWTTKVPIDNLFLQIIEWLKKLEKLARSLGFASLGPTFLAFILGMSVGFLRKSDYR